MLPPVRLMSVPPAVADGEPPQLFTKPLGVATTNPVGNVSVNCVDRHIDGSRRNKAALIWEGEPGDRRTLTYWDLYVDVQKCANMLKTLGVKRGDRVAIYMPLVPEVAIAMLA